MEIFSRFDAIYLKANDPITRRALWIRKQRMGRRVWRWCVLTSPEWEAPRVYSTLPAGEGRGEGGVQVFSPSPSAQQPADRHPSTGPANSANGTGGAKEGGGLYWDSLGQSLRLLPAWMYWLPWRSQYESLRWNGRVSGNLVILSGAKNLDPSAMPQDDKLVWTITRWPAQQGHLWGWNMVPRWAWAHGNCFVEDHLAAIEILTDYRRTLIAYQSGEDCILLNGPGIWRKTTHEISPTHWCWDMNTPSIRITGALTLGYAEMAELQYPAPDGCDRCCHNTKVGNGIIQIIRPQMPPVTLTARDTMAWEFVES